LRLVCKDLLQTLALELKTVSPIFSSSASVWRAVTKYFNKLVFYDQISGETFERRPKDAPSGQIIKFDSKLEFAVFLELKHYASSFEIKHQVSVELKPKTKYSAPANYVVDFGAYDKQVGEFDFYVEVKGLLTPEAALKLKVLEIAEPSIREKLLIVSRESSHYFGKKFPPSMSMMDFKLFLDSKYNDRKHNDSKQARVTGLPLVGDSFP
jgi:hypothetical protein